MPQEVYTEVLPKYVIILTAGKRMNHWQSHIGTDHTPVKISIIL